MNDKQINICDELSQNFINFSYEANSCRAFADARDGLKPGQRACLWEMFHKGFLSSKPHVKSAKIAGGVTGAWWPHGDVSIYDTFTRMSQPWINNIPEIDWHGNNGSQIIPDSAAAARYTEARLSKIVEEGMFKTIKKNVVPMIPNYSEDDEWPEVLPALFPRLIVNGCQGIGSTIANVWLPHNFSEMGKLILNYIDTNAIDYTTIAPDFPTGCQIINKNDLVSIYTTGKGKVILRARGEVKNNHIYIRELPYQVYVEPLIEKIKELITKEEISGIEGIYNRSSKQGIEIDVECSENAEIVLKKLYAKTDLQKAYNANQWALVGKTPKLLTLKDYIEIYIKHNIECLIKECNFDLQKAAARKEVVDGLLRALADIDDIIVLIKKSTNASTAKDNLVKVYKFTEAQAKAIVDMKLGKIASLEKIELEEEKAELEKTIAEIQNILASEDNQKAEIRNRLAALVKKYGDKRRTELAQIEIPKAEKEIEEVVPEDCVVVMSRTGDIKRVPTSSFKVQHRNGKGVKTIDDTMLDVISTNTIDTLMIFTDKGKMYRLLVDKVPAGTNVSKGTNIVNLIKCEPNEKAIAVTSLYRQSSAKYVVFITKQGLFKKTPLSEYTQTSRNVGLAAIKLVEGDSLANVTFAEDEEFLLVTKKGLTIRFESALVTPIGRVSQGVKGVKLAEGDEVIVGLPIHKKTDNLAVFFDKGTAKKVALEEFPIQGRGGKGVLVTKGASITGDIVGAALVEDSDNLLIMGKPNSICIAAKDIPLTGRPASGNLMLKGSVVTAAVKI